MILDFNVNPERARQVYLAIGKQIEWLEMLANAGYASAQIWEGVECYTVSERLRQLESLRTKLHRLLNYYQ